jgi:Fe2+ or Zn2+ uptake regulation protein
LTKTKFRLSLKLVSADLPETLKAHGIQPSAQRVAVAEFILQTDEHPTADAVWSKVRRRFPMISRATVYNTLNLFVEKGLVRQLVLAEGSVVFDPKTERHHHFIDEATGAIYDIPWGALRVSNVDSLRGFGVREYQVVIRGEKLKEGGGAKSPRRPRSAKPTA